MPRKIAEQPEGRRVVRRAQRSQRGIELTRRRRAVRKFTSGQPYTRELSGQDSAGSQEGTECPAGGISNYFESVLQPVAQPGE